jgi:hypothetical protein
MTSNQVSYYAAVETERHNKATEAELTRHDRETEKLTADLNSIQRQRSEWDKVEQDRRYELDALYKQKYYDWEKASGTKKLQLQEELNSINKQRSDWEESAAIRRNELQAMEIGVKQDVAAENKRHNQIMEEWAAFNATTDAWWKEKQIDYQNRSLEEQSSYWAGTLLNQRVRNANDFTVNYGNMLSKTAEVNANVLFLNARTENTKVETEFVPKKFWLGFGSEMVNALKTGADIGFKFIP